MYLIVEGIDGSGKSTISREIATWLDQEGYKTRLWQEPYTPEVLELLKKAKEIRIEDHIRKDIFAMLFTVDRNLMLRELRDLLTDDHQVVSDRSWLSTMAYQFDCGAELLDRLSWWVEQPDHIIYLDVETDIAFRRLTRRDGNGKDYFENVEFLEEVKENYKEILNWYPYTYSIVDANRGIGEVFEDCIEVIEPILQAEAEMVAMINQEVFRRAVP